MARCRAAATSAATGSRAPAPGATPRAGVRSTGFRKRQASAGSVAASISSAAGNRASSMRECAGRKTDSCTSPPSTCEPCHALQSQRQRRIKMVLESQIENPSLPPRAKAALQMRPRTAAARARSAPRGGETPSPAPGSPIAGPRPRVTMLLARAPARAPAICPACPRPQPFAPRRAARKSCCVIQPCSSMARPSGMRWRCPSRGLPRPSISRPSAAATRAAVQPRAAPASFEDRRFAAAPQPKPARAAVGVGAGREDAVREAGRSAPATTGTLGERPVAAASLVANSR